jgi:RNA polymerase sigma-70 factor (ECF subfamily)
LDSLSDVALVARAKADPEAFGQLYERYVKKIYNYLYYRTGDAHEAEDLTARVFYRALTRLNKYTDRGLPFSAWLYRIAHNLAANWHRDHGRRVILPLHAIAPGEWPALHADAPDLVLETKEAQERLRHAVQRLPDERQQVLILKFVERLSNAEIGVIMQRSEGAVKSLYHRTLVALREELTRLEKANGHHPLPETETSIP